MSMPLMKILNSNGPSTDPLRDSPQGLRMTLTAQPEAPPAWDNMQSQRLLTVSKYQKFYK